MKKNTLATIRTALTELGYDNAEVLAELDAELSKDQAKKDATAAAYAGMWERIKQALTDAAAPVTAQEIANETDLSRGKIVYGLTNLWADEVVKDTSGKSTTYALKA